MELVFDEEKGINVCPHSENWVQIMFRCWVWISLVLKLLLVSCEEAMTELKNSSVSIFI